MTDGSVNATLDAYITRTESVREADGLWHPSSLFSCERSAVYEVRGVPHSDPKDGRSKRILRLGSILHALVQDAYTQDSGAVRVYHEVEINIPDLGVIGHADTLEEHADGTFILDEWKSKGGDALKWALKRGDLPSEEHVKQAKTYGTALARYGGVIQHDIFCDCGACDIDSRIVIPPLGDRLRMIRVVYFSRDDLRISEHELTPDPTWGIELADTITRLNAYRDDGAALPPRLVEKQADHWLCKSYCNFRSRCWGQDGEGVEL